jgi:hypothetical protein
VALGDDTESLHVANVNFDFKPGWTLQVHTRIRTFENLSARNQYRAGPILLWQAAPRFTVISGYYYINQNRRALHDPISLHRIFAGGQYRALRGETWSVDTRSVAERFISTGFRDYWRWRNRAMLTWTMRVGQPYVSGESLVQQGIWYGRYSGGMQWRVHPKITLGAGYEYRQAPVGPGSHIIATFFQWPAYTHTPPHMD